MATAATTCACGERNWPSVRSGANRWISSTSLSAWSMSPVSQFSQARACRGTAHQSRVVRAQLLLDVEARLFPASEIHQGQDSFVAAWAEPCRPARCHATPRGLPSDRRRVLDAAEVVQQVHPVDPQRRMLSSSPLRSVSRADSSSGRQRRRLVAERLLATASVFSACASTATAPTWRAASIACSPAARRPSSRQLSIKIWACPARARARSALGRLLRHELDGPLRNSESASDSRPNVHE